MSLKQALTRSIGGSRSRTASVSACVAYVLKQALTRSIGGSKNNDKLLLNYGFVLSDNPLGTPYMCVYIYVCMYVYVYIHTYIYICVCVCMYVCMYIHVYIYYTYVGGFRD